MALSIGIVGLPNVGKSTLFTALTRKGGLAANYPFATIDPNVGIVDVPDDRLQVLADIVHPGRIVPATVEFVDIAGLVKGASEGEGLGNQFLANIRETDAICEVVRYFSDPDVIRHESSHDPGSDVDTIQTELVLADLGTLDKAIPKLEKEARRDKANARSIVQKALSKQFSPEFLNRLDEIITFDQLDLEAIKRIIDIELKGLYQRIEQIGYHIDLADDAKEFVATKGYDVQFGARPLKRAIQNYIEDGISDLIVNGNLEPGATIHITLKENELAFS